MQGFSHAETIPSRRKVKFSKSCRQQAKPPQTKSHVFPTPKNNTTVTRKNLASHPLTGYPTANEVALFGLGSIQTAWMNQTDKSAYSV